MKTFKTLMSIAVLVAVIISCEKSELTENQDATTLANTENSLRLTKSATTTAPTEQDDFTINFAGIYDEYFYMGMTYSGGNKAHEFKVDWDGQVKTSGDRKTIELIVYHMTTGDDAEMMISDSLVAKLSEFNIPKETLEKDNLWFKVINSTNANNVLEFQAEQYNNNPDNNGTTTETGGTTTETPSSYNVKAKVVEVECNTAGIWENLWLKEDNKSNYFVVTKTEESIKYDPLKDDHLDIEYQYSYIDSTAMCDQFQSLQAAPVQLMKLNKLDN